MPDVTQVDPDKKQETKVCEKTGQERKIPDFVKRHHKDKLDEQKRDVACFTCETTHRAPREAQATNCPKCGAYIALNHVKIDGTTNKPIYTRGNVTVTKNGRFVGAVVHCHHLLVHGDFTGGVDCSGDFTIFKHGRIMGRVDCATLRIEKGSKVEFANTVYCSGAHIDGELHGNIICGGKVKLAPKAKLIGNLRVRGLEISEGAKHSGQITFDSGT